MVYPDTRYLPDHYYQPHSMKDKKPSKMEKLLRTLPPPCVDQTFDYCFDCKMYRHLRFRKLLFGNIEVSTSCCGRVVGYLDFPHGMRWSKRKLYLAWLNH